MLNEKGYTYVELTIVIAVIAIIVAVVLPSFRAVHRYELKQQAEMVSDTIRDAQKLAINENKVFKVKISGNNELQIISEGLVDTIEKTVVLKNGIEFYPASLINLTLIKYNTKGVAEGTVTDANLKNEYKINIDIKELTGKVELGEIHY
jgi:Tfp pilus assembly protein FimT